MTFTTEHPLLKYATVMGYYYIRKWTKRCMQETMYAANIPNDICKKIDRIKNSAPIQECVYRVSKSGNIDEQTFENTFAEVLKGTTSKNKDFDDVGTYSTSFYLSPDPCNRWKLFLAEKFRKRYPSPCVIKGGIDASYGKFQRTIERSNAGDPLHIDMWIYEDKIEDLVGEFEIIEE